MRRTLILAALLATTVGCVLRGPSDVRREISASTGATLDHEFSLTLGRTSMGLVKMGMRMADEDQISLEGVHKVQIGVYRVAEAGDDGPMELRESLLPSWQRIVSIRDGGDDVMILVQEKNERIRSMLIAVLDDEELVVVRMKGKLDRMLQEAMRYGLDQAGREDLYENAVADADERGALGS